MRDCLLKQFGSSGLPSQVAVLLEYAHAVARGVNAGLNPTLNDGVPGSSH